MEVPLPSVRVCGCPNGCVNLQIGFVSFHFDRASFRVFVGHLVRLARDLDAAYAPADN